MQTHHCKGVSFPVFPSLMVKWVPILLRMIWGYCVRDEEDELDSVVQNSLNTMCEMLQRSTHIARRSDSFNEAELEKFIEVDDFIFHIAINL